MAQRINPRFLRYFPVVLDALRSKHPDPMSSVDAVAWVRDHVDVSREDFERTIEGGSQTIFENDVHWARFYLAKAGLVANPRRGSWALTPAGLEAHLTHESAADVLVRIRDASRPGAAHEEEIVAPDVSKEGR